MRTSIYVHAVRKYKDGSTFEIPRQSHLIAELSTVVLVEQQIT